MYASRLIWLVASSPVYNSATVTSIHILILCFPFHKRRDYSFRIYNWIWSDWLPFIFLIISLPVWEPVDHHQSHQHLMRVYFLSYIAKNSITIVLERTKTAQNPNEYGRGNWIWCWECHLLNYSFRFQHAQQ